ncbi:hypothetical protein [Parasitella parasitica]|uniref:Uncharacterized protein n=1 Tax=Parasitella parasitica TaxID=35722 RepID=A0A0B7NJX4_9FUNG|nr:hypothetical protein [Parasitella parasitica]
MQVNDHPRHQSQHEQKQHLHQRHHQLMKNSASTLSTHFSFASPNASVSASQPMSFTQHPPSSTDAAIECLEITIQAIKKAEPLPALLRIWFDGLPGYHPVCKLDSVYGAKKWRGVSGLSKFYQPR